MSKQAINTFKEGLVMDLNPLANDNKSLTNALNATFITQNGNELMLLNDMGNGRINRVRLDDGYIPIGIKEYGGIIYVASYNPKNSKGQIGSFPYPKLEWEGQDFTNISVDLVELYGDDDSAINVNTIDLNGQPCLLNLYLIIGNSTKIPLLVDNSGNHIKIHSGDSFSISFNNETKELLSKSSFKLKLIVKTSSSYFTVTEDKEGILNGSTFIYGGSYSGYLYLQIDLDIYDEFEIDYVLDIENNSIKIYPRASYSNRNNIIGNKAIVYDHNLLDTLYTNVYCNLELINNYIEIYNLSDGENIYDIYPITDDGGYINELHRKIIINKDKFCADDSRCITLFKYTFDDTTNTVKVFFEYCDKNDLYLNDNLIEYHYRFYPIDIISNINVLNNNFITSIINSRDYVLEIVKGNYHTKSGVRYFEGLLPNNKIYLMVGYYKRASESLSNLKPVLYRFVYGTPRYNNYYYNEDINDFNEISEQNEIYVDYSITLDIFTPELKDITHKHYINNNWEYSKSIVKYSKDPIPVDQFPTAFKSRVAISLNRNTDETLECIPNSHYNYIYDNEVYYIPNSSLKIILPEASNGNAIYDYPLKFKQGILYTEEDNRYEWPTPNNTPGEESFTFYRYISALGNNNLVLQERSLKTLCPVFNPKNDNSELIGWDLKFPSIFLESVVVDESGMFIKSPTTVITSDINGYQLPNTSVAASNFVQVAGDENLAEGLWVQQVVLKEGLRQFALLKTDVPSIFNIVSGLIPNDDASIKFSNLNSNIEKGMFSPGNNSNELNANGDWQLGTCLDANQNHHVINIGGTLRSKFFSNGNYLGTYLGADALLTRTDPIYVDSLDNISSNSYPTIKPLYFGYNTFLSVAKKLLCILSLLFTVLSFEEYINMVGPSTTGINYNIQDPSYFKYKYYIKDEEDELKKINFTKNIDYSLKTISTNFVGCNTNGVYAVNYINSIYGNEIEATFRYGYLVDMSSELYKFILSNYEDIYSNSEILDESNKYSEDKIYYLNANSLTNIYSENSLIDLENTNPNTYNEIWNNSGIFFNPEYHCFEYDLGKLNLNCISESKSTDAINTIIDWTGVKLPMESIAKTFITVYKALKDYPGAVPAYSNNYILLNPNSNVNSGMTGEWTNGKNNHTAFSVQFINFIFGRRGLFYKGSVWDDSSWFDIHELKHLYKEEYPVWNFDTDTGEFTYDKFIEKLCKIYNLFTLLWLIDNDYIKETLEP